MICWHLFWGFVIFINCSFLFFFFSWLILFPWDVIVKFLSMLFLLLLPDAGTDRENQSEPKWSWGHCCWYSIGARLPKSKWMQDGCILCWFPWYFSLNYPLYFWFCTHFIVHKYYICDFRNCACQNCEQAMFIWSSGSCWCSCCN